MLTGSAADATRRPEKRVVVPICQPLKEQRQLKRMVVGPHAGFAARNLAAGGNVIPAVRRMVNGMKQQPLVLFVGREIRLVKERVGNRQPGLEILFARRL